MNPSANVKDPLLWLSILLAATGTLQASTNLLTPLMAAHPTGFGLVMTGISVLTATLTVLRTALMNRDTAQVQPATASPTAPSTPTGG